MHTGLPPRTALCESLQQTLLELAALASHTKQAHCTTRHLKDLKRMNGATD